VRRTDGEKILRAFATVTLDDAFAIHNIKVIEGPNGLFVSMPARRKRDGTFQNIAHPTTREARELLERAVLDAYSGAEGAEGAGIGAPLRPGPPSLVGKAARVIEGS
jgi:stage V sporulation protein G